ncbi:unnamed protein product [Durusdinium trenchii]|uniref:Methyltransferase type 11 domain-containing protein n=1 Tax=Durusdinium trenchii TaxID=1381693 RepID=A0ABP0LLK7_9DINO
MRALFGRRVQVQVRRWVMSVPGPATEGEASASGRLARQGGKRSKKKAQGYANEGAENSGRRGPSGQELKGPLQKTTAVEVAPEESENVLKTPAIEAENVHKVYDAIASHWNHTRYKAWPRVEAFVRSLPRHSLVADLGCGNGKNLPHVKEAGGFAVASDISAPLAQIAAEEHGASCMVADCLAAPLRDGAFDAVLSIAVLHHLSTRGRRVQALREAARLLRVGGQLLVYCWSFEQDDDRSRSRHRFVAQDVLVPWSFRTPGLKKGKPSEQPEPAPGGRRGRKPQRPKILPRVQGGRAGRLVGGGPATGSGRQLLRHRELVCHSTATALMCRARRSSGRRRRRRRRKCCCAQSLSRAFLLAAKEPALRTTLGA